MLEIRTSLALALFGAIVCSRGGTARADATSVPARLEVLALRSDDAEDQAEALTVALRARVRADKRFAPSGGDYSLEVLTLALHCGEVPDGSCQARIASEIHSDRYVWGIVHRAGAVPKKVRAELHYWEKGQPPRSTEVMFDERESGSAAVMSNAAALGRTADEALRALVPSAVADATNARASSSAPQPGAAALVGGTRARTAPSTPDSPFSRASEPEEQPAADTNGGQRAAGWGAIGLGAVLLGASGYSALRVHQVQNDEGFDRYRQGFHSGEDVCQQASLGVPSAVPGAASPGSAHDLCSQATTFETLEFVFLGLGAVSLGAGIYFLATGHRAAPSGITFHVAPRVARSSAGLAMTVAGF